MKWLFDFFKRLFEKRQESDRIDPTPIISTPPQPEKDGIINDDVIVNGFVSTGVQGKGRQLDAGLKRLIDQAMIKRHGALAVLNAMREDKHNWLVWAVADAIVEMDVKELPSGSNKGPIVSKIQDTVGGPDPSAWCMSFVQTCIAWVEDACGIVSPIAAGEHVYTVFHQSYSKAMTQIPATGHIGCLNYPPSKSGHTFVLKSKVGLSAFTEEGNTTQGLDSQGRPVRDGGGAHHCKRSLSEKPGLKFLGWLKPFDT